MYSKIPGKCDTTTKKRAHVNFDDVSEYYTQIEGRNTESEEEQVPTRQQTRKQEKAARKRASREVYFFTTLKAEHDSIQDREKKKKEKEKSFQEKQLQKERERLEEEEQLKKEQEEKAQKEYQEYLNLKADIIIEEEGASALTQQENQRTLTEFINLIKENKIIEFDALASHFDMPVSDAVERVKSLLESKELQGFIDDRGKFIYVSDDDLLQISRHIEAAGRCSFRELSRTFGEILNLT